MQLSYAGPYVMRETNTVYSADGGVVNGVTVEPVTITRNTKTRQLVGVLNPFAEQPFMTKGQFGILASLYLARRR
jgi:hypothetical protein